MQIVEAGQMTDAVKKLINKIFSGLDKCLEDIDDWADKKEEKDIEEDGIRGKYYLYEVGDNGTLEVEVFGVEDHPDKFIVRCRHDNKDIEESDILTKDTIVDWLTDYAEKHDLGVVNPEGVDEADLAASNKISVTLQKVTSAKECNVELVAINASQCIGNAMDVLTDVLQDDSFVNSLKDEPTSYEIAVQPDEYSVEEIDNSEVDITDTCPELLKLAFETNANIDYLRYNIHGNIAMSVRPILENVSWTIRSIESTCKDWCIQDLRYFANLLTVTPGHISVISQNATDDDQIKECIVALYRLIDALECYTVNLSQDRVCTLAPWISELHKVADMDLGMCLTMPDTQCSNISVPCR